MMSIVKIENVVGQGKIWFNLDTLISIQIVQTVDLVEDKEESIRDLFDQLKSKSDPLVQIEWAKGPESGKFFVEGFADERAAAKFIEYELL